MPDKAVPDDRAAPAAAGFTLIEVMVALAIFSLAALALLRLQGAALATTARLDDTAVAGIVAQNLAIAARLQPQPPAFGRAQGEDVNAGRRWRWVQDVVRSADPRLQRIDIVVAAPDGHVAARASLVRRIQ